MRKRRRALDAIVGLGLPWGSARVMQSAQGATAESDAVYAKAYALCVDVHQHPEIPEALG